MEIHFYYDHGFGSAEAQVSAPYQAVGWLLRHDVQRNLETCDEIDSACERAIRGELEGDDLLGNGNAHTWEYFPEGVRITNDYQPSPDVVMPMATFREILHRWRAFITDSTTQEMKFTLPDVAPLHRPGGPPADPLVK